MISAVARIWMETGGVVALAAAGAVVGHWCSTFRRPWWLTGYVAPLLLVVLVVTSRRFPSLELRVPFAWIMAGRMEFALLAPAVASLMMTPLSRLKHRRERVLITCLMVVFVVVLSVLPFLAPAFNWRYLADLTTVVDADGVCIQSNGYTCGPAAAVTVLHRIGVPAEEGRLAIAAHTTRFAGTPADSLCSAIRREYGVDCRRAYFRTVDDLKGKEPAIAVVRYAVLIDHYVAVLNITESSVEVGDPLVGRREWSREEFTKRWRGSAIVLTRPSEGSELD